MTNPSDLKELVPEWFYSPSFLYNDNSLPLGLGNDGRLINDALLPPWVRLGQRRRWCAPCMFFWLLHLLACLALL
jgi:hypothetical protein